MNPYILARRTIQSVILLVLTATGNLNGIEPAALYLTWQRSPDTTMTVLWLTPIKGKGDGEDNLLLYTKEGSEAWSRTSGTHAKLPEEAPYYLHTVELTNLKPSTEYLVRVGDDSEGRTFKFRTMPSTLDPHNGGETTIHFVAGGDMYHDDIKYLIETNRAAAKTSPHFALVGGDIAYAAPKKAGYLPSWAKTLAKPILKQKFDRWLAWLVAWTNEMVTPDGRSIPLLPVIGNHDCNGSFNVTPAEAPFFYALFPMPGAQGYNAIDFGNYMSLILLDSAHTHPIEGKQTEWLATALRERKDVANKFALYHVPAYPSARPFDYKYSEKIRANWTPLFDKYGLTAAFENHDHDYKRTYPLLGGKIVKSGVLYFGDGAWGVEEPRKPVDVKTKGYLARALKKAHFLQVTFDTHRRTVSAITPKGETIDTYTW